MSLLQQLFVPTKALNTLDHLVPAQTKIAINLWNYWLKTVKKQEAQEKQ